MPGRTGSGRTLSRSEERRGVSMDFAAIFFHNCGSPLCPADIFSLSRIRPRSDVPCAALAEAEGEDGLAGGQDEALVAVDGVGHGAAFELLAGFEVPEDFAVGGVGCDDGAVGVGVEDEAAGGGHEAAV